MLSFNRVYVLTQQEQMEVSPWHKHSEKLPFYSERKCSPSPWHDSSEVLSFGISDAKWSPKHNRNEVLCLAQTQQVPSVSILNIIQYSHLKLHFYYFKTQTKVKIHIYIVTSYFFEPEWC